MRLLLNEMYPATLARALRSAGVDTVAVDEHQPFRGLSDEELLTVATRERRVIVTENVSDFMRLTGEWAATRREHAGVIVALSSRFSRSPAGQTDLVERLTGLYTERRGDDELNNSVYFLTRAST